MCITSVRFRFPRKQPTTVQGKLEERNAGYWRIVSTLDQEIPPAWVTHAARKRAKRAKANAAARAAAAIVRIAADGAAEPPPSPPAPFSPKAFPIPRGPFKDRVDRVFFFGDLNYRVDLSREDMELGVSVCRRKEEGTERNRRGTRLGRRFKPGKIPNEGAFGLEKRGSSIDRWSISRWLIWPGVFVCREEWNTCAFFRLHVWRRLRSVAHRHNSPS